MTDRQSIRELVAVLGADPPSTALLFDFDGTLSPIVDDPASARPAVGALAALDRLAERYGVVAIVSGRPRDFLVDRIGPAVDLSGCYGLETRTGGLVADHPDAAPWRPVLARLDEHGYRDGDVTIDLPPGAELEHKGLSVTVHFRRAPAVASQVAIWADEVAASTGLLVGQAKQSLELHPPVDVDKGTTVQALAADRTTVAYVGDDRGDLPAFDALDALAAAGVTTRRIVVASAELPAEVRARADVVLDGPAAVVALMEALGGA